ncbi:MAG: hypothetical protein Q9159_004961 [Coniocarpon cinnabarinum]
MGVTGLWEVVQPCARPIKIDTLNKKRLAIDASIWVYHFLKAVRDKEGNALRNSHVVGFYRRICKLLFFGIKPVFVFDGGAPALKRQTITGRKARREGRREDATRTAGKLLALQMHRAAEEEEERQRREAERPHERDDNEETVPENPVYVDELQMTQQERQQNRKFRKKDQYHLPDLSVSLAEMGGPNDPRVMSLEELQQYAKQFETGEDINVYDFSKIDFDSPFFTSLPASDRYNILNAARLRSRLRMGYSKDQLEAMFPDRMEFSRFQIERVRERNELTQRLMQVGTPEDGLYADAAGRVAGEKGREYVLVKNPDVEGGWALGVIGENDQDEGKREKPIDIDEKARQAAQLKAEEERQFQSSESEDDEELAKNIQQRREAFYKSRRQEEGRVDEAVELGSPKEDENSLFVAEDGKARAAAAPDTDESEDEEAQLQIALAMSLEGVDEEASSAPEPVRRPQPKLPKQRKAPESASFAKSKGPVASMANARAHRAAPNVTTTNGFHDNSSDDDLDLDLQGALAESRQSKYKTKSPVRRFSPPAPKLNNTSNKEQQKFDGPLPFEKLDLGTSLLGKKKMKQMENENAGGFVKDLGKRDDDDAEKSPPPWFAGNVEKGMEAQRQREAEERKQARQMEEDEAMFRPPPPRLRKEETNEIIDLDAMDRGSKEPIPIDSSDDDSQDPQNNHATEQVEVIDPEIRFGDMAERVRAEPPPGVVDSYVPDVEQGSEVDVESKVLAHEQNGHPEDEETHHEPSPSPAAAPKRNASSLFQSEDRSDEEVEWEASDVEDVPPAKRRKADSDQCTPELENNLAANESDGGDIYIPDENLLKEWEASQNGSDIQTEADAVSNLNPAASMGPNSPAKPGGGLQSPQKGTTRPQSAQPEPQPPGRHSPAQEDIYIPTEVDLADMEAENPSGSRSPSSGPVPASGTAVQATEPHPVNMDDDLPFSDNDSDEDLMISMAAEAEEHARFTSAFNTKTPQQNIADYEAELKALRSQQKKDRRDADEVTTIMIQECQQLLKLFGLPYITAPMEAEAQCAELVALGLVDGIVTDDSDIFLFGGTRVYKNMFNQAKYVECYLASDLERDFDLTRKKMIAIAHLLGSDYTEGLPGIGPVTALEILTDFPESLSDFREWFTGLQQGNTLTDADKQSAFRKKFKKQTTKLFLPPSFPDQRVELAYLNPEVDSDPSAFQWGVPDLDALRSFLMATIGWSQERTDEVLVPIIRDMNRRENEGTQANITAFLGGNTGVGAGAFAPRVRAEGKSRRMETALEKMAERARRRRKNGATAADGNGEEAIISTSGSAVDGSAGVSVTARPEKRSDEVSKKGDSEKRPEKAQEKSKRGKGNKNLVQTADHEADEQQDSASGSEFEAEKPKRRSRKQTRRRRAAAS